LSEVKPYGTAISHERDVQNHEIGVNKMNAFKGQTFQMNQIINIKDVIQFTSISRAKIYEMINGDSKYYDPSFPKPIRLSESRIGWVALEIHQWIEAKIQSR